MNANARAEVSVTYQTQILNPDGSIAKSNPPKKNLVLDSGLDRMAVESIVSCFEYAVAGTGSTPTNRDSSTTTFTRSGTTVTASGNFFEAGDAGRLLKFDSGEEMYIVTFNSATEVVVDTSGTLTASEGTIYYVNETAHGSESKRTNTYATDSGDNGTTLASGTWTHKRTFLFSAEAGSVTYTEIGWSWGTTGTDLFGRDLVSGGGDSLITGQQYKVVVEVSYAITPYLQTALSDIGNNGFVTTGDHTFASVGGAQAFFARVNANGSENFKADIYSPATNFTLVYWTVDFTLPAAMTDDDTLAAPNGFTPATRTTPTYVAGSFTKTLVWKASVSQMNSANIYGIAITGASQSRWYACKFDNPQTKDSDHTLEITFTWTWDRVLVN